MSKPKFSIIVSICAILVGLPQAAHADFTKTIQAAPGVPVQAVTTWYVASCTQSLGVGSYSVNVAPKYGTLAFSSVSGPAPGCPAGSPSLPAVAAFYTLSASAPAGTPDYFQLYYNLNGGVAQVEDITVNPAPTDSLAITTDALPSTISGDLYNPFQLMSSGGQGTVTWAASGNIPAGFSLSSSGILSNSVSPPQYPDAGTYSITFTATDSQISVSKTLDLVIASESCADNAVIDVTKIYICTLGGLNACTTSLSPELVGNNLYLSPGTFLNTAKRAPFDPFFFFPGMDIRNAPDAVTYPADGIPVSDIQFVYVQTLDTWSGYSVYRGSDGDFQEHTAVPLPSSEDDYPGSPIYYPGAIFDSPQVGAPIRDPSGRFLVGMNYAKTFTAYLGCHTARDEKRYPLQTPISATDARHFIRTLATVKWGVNFTGDIRFNPLSCFSYLSSFNCFNFVPDENAGVYYQPVAIPSSAEPPVTSKANAPYNPF